MEVFLNFGLGVGILMLFVLFFKEKKVREDYFLLSWVAVILLQITFYQITIYQFQLTGLLAIIGFALPLLSAPILFLYIKLLTGKKVSSSNIFLHLSIFIVYVAGLQLFLCITTSTVIAEMGILNIQSGSSFIKNYYAVPLGISGITYGIWDLFLLRQHRKRVFEVFSYDEKINLRWIQYIVYGFFLLVLIISFLIFGVSQLKLFEASDAFGFLGIALSGLLITFGFYGFKQTEVFSNLNFQYDDTEEYSGNTKQQKSNYTKSGLTKNKIITYAQQVTDHMKKEKPFLHDDLTLPILAEQCNISNVHLSQVLNQHFQLNFYDFVNQYRIEESKKMLVSSEYNNLSILGIAFSCGFKSKSSFNRYFKKYNGVSPSVYKESKS